MFALTLLYMARLRRTVSLPFSAYHRISHESNSCPLPTIARNDNGFDTDINSISDFPSLSGGPRPQQNASNSGGWNSNAIRQPSTQQQPQGQQPQQRAPSAAPSQQSLDQFEGQRTQQAPMDRQGSGDDFPPLGGQVNGDAFAQANGINSGVGSPDMQQPRMNGQQTQLPIRESSSTFQQTQPPPVNQQSSQSQPQPSQNGQPPPAPSGLKNYADMTENEKWALPGLMAAFEARRQSENNGQVDDSLPASMRCAIIMGHELGALGMDLDSPDPIHPTFMPFQAVGSSGSTFDFHERHMVPDFTLPSAYTVTNVPPLSSRMSAFADGMFTPSQTRPLPLFPRLAHSR